MDLCFSPFHENLLATAGAGSSAGDATIKLWTIPEEGLTESTDENNGELCSHSSKINHLKWHPTADFTMASVSMKGQCKLWDVQNQQEVS